MVKRRSVQARGIEMLFVIECSTFERLIFIHTHTHTCAVLPCEYHDGDGPDVCIANLKWCNHRRNGPMREMECKFYAAGIVNALDFLHQRNIAHRDVKPENIVLDRHGYPVLIDFGCARSIIKQSMTICGTPLYVAPEVLTCKGHSTAVDCWSFGVLLYELLTASTPFKTIQDETVDDVYENIIDCCYSMPDYVGTEASNLIDSLLQVRVNRRLGALRGKWMDVRSHEFFRDYNNIGVQNRSVDAPWVPDFSRVVQKACDNAEKAKLVYRKRRKVSVIEQHIEAGTAAVGGRRETKKDWDEAF